MRNIMGTTNFFTFASEQSNDPAVGVGFGILEGTPHNYSTGSLAVT